MKKTIVMIAVATLVVAVGVGAYAHYEDYNRGWGMRGVQPGTSDQRGGMMYGQRGGMMYGQRGGKGGYGHGMMRGRGHHGAYWNAQTGVCPCDSTYGTQDVPTQQTQVVSEDTVRESAESYLNTYLSGYTIEKIEKDSWRPLYLVTIKGENDAVQTMVVHGFSGEVVNVFPQAVSK